MADCPRTRVDNSSDSLNHEENNQNRPTIKIPEDFEGFPIKSLFIEKELAQDLQTVLVTGGMIRDRIQIMAHHIMEDFFNRPFVVLCVLKGGYRFFSEIVECLRDLAHSNAGQWTLKFTVEFIRLKSYANDASTGDVKIFNPEVLTALKEKHVLVVEDIIDTGLSMQKLMKKLDESETKSAKVAALMVKRKNVTTFVPDYVGFEIPDSFVVGYNLDYNDCFRNLNHVCIISEPGKRKYALRSQGY